jgi:hypothetical protein
LQSKQFNVAKPNQVDSSYVKSYSTGKTLIQNVECKVKMQELTIKHKSQSGESFKQNIQTTYETERWPARTAGRRSENGKIPVNPAKASASRAVCLVFAENHYFARIYGILSVREGAWFWQRLWSFCLSKGQKNE